MHKGYRWLILSLAIIGLDQWTKIWAQGALQFAQPVPVLPGLNWTLLYNKGAAFSFLANAGGWQTAFFTLIAVVASAVILYLLGRPRPEGEHIAYALILGGALGNLIDRLTLGHVVDFIDVYYGQAHWPAFNIADVGITLGALLVVIREFRARPSEEA